eukprot:TRINITY_DN88858_c0_g1_i1.p1 TRINITY_DN88858_c0_g1~~TRINITY_DN88858_c0_g1_i1.p1  ORF type:complete len:778 (+),score=108.48 TRINITY_DN88858_c0_g1_i1:39-2336(+)
MLDGGSCSAAMRSSGVGVCCTSNRRCSLRGLSIIAATCSSNLWSTVVFSEQSCNAARRRRGSCWHSVRWHTGSRQLSSLKAGGGAAADAASIGIVEPLVSQLPRHERENLLSVLRLLASPVNAGWIPVVIFLAIRVRFLEYVVTGSKRLRRWLTTYRRRIPTDENRAAVLEALSSEMVLRQAVRLASGDVLPQGHRIVQPSYLGDVLILDGFENTALNASFASSNSEDLHNGRPVFHARDGGYILSSAAGPDGDAWIASTADSYYRTRYREGTSHHPWKYLGALAVSPPNSSLASAPMLGWQELDSKGIWQVRENAGLQSIRAPDLPLEVRLLPASSPKVGAYTDSYFQVLETPVSVWSVCFMVLQLTEILLLRQASTRSLRHMIVNFITRLRWSVTATALATSFHFLMARWKQRRSRGRAVISDVLGVQSSQREARLSALVILVQSGGWIFWFVCVLAICGIEPGRVLLSTSVGALFLGFLGKDVISNVLSGLVIYITQPFAQGDWITLEQGQDGWAEEIGLFYTKLIQWNKRPLYVPNFRIVQMLVQNNSRMTNRRIRFDLQLRLRDIPKVPKIVNDIQKMLDDHPEIDSVMHRIVSWRQVGEYSASIWLSCYTLPTQEGIRLTNLVKVEQSVLERSAAIIYKHGADFASTNQRLHHPEAHVPGGESTKIWQAPGLTGFASETGKAPASETSGDVSSLRQLIDTRDDVLKAKEERLRTRELEVERLAEELSQKAQDLQQKEVELKARDASAEKLDEPTDLVVE